MLLGKIIAVAAFSWRPYEEAVVEVKYVTYRLDQYTKGKCAILVCLTRINGSIYHFKTKQTRRVADQHKFSAPRWQPSIFVQLFADAKCYFRSQ